MFHILSLRPNTGVRDTPLKKYDRQNYVVRMQEMRNELKMLVRIPEEKKPLG